MNEKIDRDRVARHAGVSSATVSRVFNHPEKVSREKREIVLKAAEELNYKPNMNAALLARGIYGKILLLDNNKLLRYDSNNSSFYAWLYVDLLNQIRDVLKNSMFDLVISNLEDLKLHNFHNLKDFDGVICFDIDNEEDLASVLESGVPYVFGHHVRDITLPGRVYTDNFYGGYLQARFLKETGHDCSIYITGLRQSLNVHQERFEGFIDAYGVDNIHLIEGSIGKDGGAESISTALPLIKSGKYKAVAAVNDLTAIGIYFELMSSGVKIPEDVSLIGYDNMPFTTLLPLRLSTIDIRIGELYRRAAEQLLDRINGKPSAEVVCLKPGLVRGMTVKER